MKKVEVEQVQKHGITFEAPSKSTRQVKKFLVNPLINYLPRSFFFWLLRKTQSPLVLESLRKAGSWQTMRISYENKPHVDLLDKLFLTFGTFPMGLRNRKRLVVKKLVEFIGRHPQRPLHVLGIGAGPGTNIIEALAKIRDSRIFAHLIDMDSAAFEYGRELARRFGLPDGQITYTQGNAVELAQHLQSEPHLVKLIGILEYLTDEQVQGLFDLAYRVMPPGGHIVVNSISNRHGHDRFMRRIFNLHLNYRTPDELMALLRKSGFTQFDLAREPLKIYYVIVGEKNSQ